MSWLKAKDWVTGVEYSSLFHSGLRAISLRPGARVRRARSSSAASRERTSSLASLPSRSLRRRTARTRHRTPSTSRESSPVPQSRPRRIMRQRTSSMFASKEDAWSSQGRFYGIGDLPEEECLRAEYILPEFELEALYSGSRPFFVDLGELDADAVSPVGEESFLSLSQSSDGISQHLVQRCKYPASMPFPSRHPSAPHRRDRSDCAWTLEESSPELKTGDLGDDEKEEEEIPHEVDWRQFHVDWVQNIL